MKSKTMLRAEAEIRRVEREKRGDGGQLEKLKAQGFTAGKEYDKLMKRTEAKGQEEAVKASKKQKKNK